MITLAVAVAVVVGGLGPSISERLHSPPPARERNRFREELEWRRARGL